MGRAVHARAAELVRATIYLTYLLMQFIPTISYFEANRVAVESFTALGVNAGRGTLIVNSVVEDLANATERGCGVGATTGPDKGFVLDATAQAAPTEAQTPPGASETGLSSTARGDHQLPTGPGHSTESTAALELRISVHRGDSGSVPLCSCCAWGSRAAHPITRYAPLDKMSSNDLVVMQPFVSVSGDHRLLNRPLTHFRKWAICRTSIHGPNGPFATSVVESLQTQNPDITNAIGCASTTQYLSGVNSTTPNRAAAEKLQTPATAPMKHPKPAARNHFIGKLPVVFHRFSCFGQFLPIPKAVPYTIEHRMNR